MAQDVKYVHAGSLGPVGIALDRKAPDRADRMPGEDLNGGRVSKADADEQRGETDKVAGQEG